MFSFIISTAAIIVIPITRVIQPIIVLTVHCRIIIVIVFIVTSLKIIFKNF